MDIVKEGIGKIFTNPDADEARNLVGYSVLQMFVHIPIVFFLCWLFAQYIPFIPPVK